MVAVLAALIACEEAPAPAPAPPPLTVVAPADGASAPDPETETLTWPPSSGSQCRDDDDCAASASGRPGRCLCTVPIPDGPVPTTGLCWNGRMKPNAWWCTVQDGHAFPRGLFVPE